MSNRFKLKPLALATMLISQGAVHGAYAQSDQEDEQNSIDQEEIVEVKGFRSSILKAQDTKRNAQGIVDAIHAEDIGKSTDQNIADALSRVTGVSVQTVDGEGTRISVRGTTANQNLITLNGTVLTSSDVNQAVDLSSFSSDILSKIEVSKTSMADQDEGALGAIVKLTTSKPLELKENVRQLTFQGRYSDFSEEIDSKVSGSISHKFFDDTFGVLFTGYYETDSVRKDQIKRGRYVVVDVDRATDQNNNIVGGFKALASESTEYSLFQNERNRLGGTLGLQYSPFSSTDISLDYTFAEQEVKNDDHALRVSAKFDKPNFREGVASAEHPDVAAGGRGEFYFPDYSDPSADWWTVDTDRRLVTKSLNRFGGGVFGRRTSGDKVVNNAANLKIVQEITDSITVDVGVGYSDTQSDSLPNYQAQSANWQYALDNVVAGAGEYGTAGGIEPVGYDCSSGVCQIVVGHGLVSDLSETSFQDNIASSAFTPFDVSSHHLGNLNRNTRNVSDTQSSVFFDLDWDVDLFGITKVEIGGKTSHREKSTDIQNFKFEQVTAPASIDRYDQYGNLVGSTTVPGSGLSSIPLINIVSSESFPVDNFLSSFGVTQTQANGQRSVASGWPVIDAKKAFELAFGVDGTEVVRDETQSRSAEIDIAAAYLKLNFEYFDFMSGNFGVRYAETEVSSVGYSGANYFSSSLDRTFDPFHIKAIRDDSLDPCIPQQPILNAEGNEVVAANGAGGEINRIYARIDGNGWDLQGTNNDYSDDIHIPQPNYPNDPLYGNLAGQPVPYPCYDQGAEGVFRNWFNYRHADWSTEDNLRLNPDNPEELTDKNLQFFETLGSHKYSNLLPSLNLNFALNDDMVLRFAASKTIARPNIDDLKPGFRFEEGIWGAAQTDQRSGNKITLSNPQLNPMKSTNLDLSYEWYFNDKSQFSVAVFRKDLSDFLESEDLQVYATDLRNVDLSQGFDASTLVKTEEQIQAEFDDPASDQYGRGVCFPYRAIVNQVTQDWFNDDGFLNKCAVFTATRQRNGENGLIQGIEFGYSQAYDFLPGFLGGLGTQLNLTLQDSSNDQEVTSLGGDTILPEFPRAYTPQQSYNATVYWEQNGALLRIAYRGKSDELIQRAYDNGALWLEGSSHIDFSAGYEINDMFSLSFDIVNLTNTEHREFWTSRTLDLGDTALDANGDVVPVEFDEGNIYENSNADKSKTRLRYTTGTRYRLGLQVKF